MSSEPHPKEKLSDLGTFVLPPPTEISRYAEEKMVAEEVVEEKMIEEKVFKLEVLQLHHVSRSFINFLTPGGGHDVCFRFNRSHKLMDHPLCWFGRKPNGNDDTLCESPSPAIDVGKSRYGWIEFAASWQTIFGAYLNQTQANEVGLFAMCTASYQREWAHAVLVAPIGMAPVEVGDPIATVSFDRGNVDVSPTHVSSDSGKFSVLVVAPESRKEPCKLHWTVRRLEGGFNPWEYLEFAFLGYDEIGEYFRVPQESMTLQPIEHVKPFVPRNDSAQPKDLQQAKEAIVYELLTYLFPPTSYVWEQPADYKHTSNILECSTELITDLVEIFRDCEKFVGDHLKYTRGTEYRATNGWILSIQDVYPKASYNRIGDVSLLLAVVLRHLIPSA